MARLAGTTSTAVPRHRPAAVLTWLGPTYGGVVPDTSAVPTEHVLILSCPDQRGIVATVTALLFEHGANIEESQQFLDVRTNQFFMRIRFSVRIGGAPTPRWRELFAPVATDYGMDWSIRDASTPYRALLMVSRFGHCLNDLLFRWRSGALNMDIPAVVSNHRSMRCLCMTSLPATREWRSPRACPTSRSRTR